MKKTLVKLLSAVMALGMALSFTACSEGLPECTTHTEKWITDKAATCTEQGFEHAECENCGRYLGAKFIEATGHDVDSGTCGTCGNSVATEGLHFIELADKSGYALAGIGMAETADIVIPAIYKGKPVKEIVSEAFDDNKISSVYIPSSVKNIDTGAFFSCELLTKVIIENGVEQIQDSAFFACTSLTEIVIPISVNIMGEQVFGSYENNSTLSIKCQAQSRPDGWSDLWYSFADNINIIWGYTENN